MVAVYRLHTSRDRLYWKTPCRDVANSGIKGTRLARPVADQAALLDVGDVSGHVDRGDVSAGRCVHLRRTSTSRPASLTKPTTCPRGWTAA